MDYKFVGKRIRERRSAMGFTQERLAERIHKSCSFVGHIERGTRKLSLETFFEIAEALQCPADDLLGRCLSEEEASGAKELLVAAVHIAERIDRSKKE